MRDVNKDLLFDKSDESIWYKAKWSDEDWVLTEVVDAAGRAQIEKLYFDQWLKKEVE